MDKLGRGKKKKSRLQLQPLINWITRPYATLGKGSRVDLFNFPVYALESQSAYWCRHRTWHLTTQSLSTVWHTSFPEIWPQPNSHNPSQTFHNGLIRDKIFCLILVTAANLLSLQSIFEKSSFRQLKRTLLLFKILRRNMPALEVMRLYPMGKI